MLSVALAGAAAAVSVQEQPEPRTLIPSHTLNEKSGLYTIVQKQWAGCITC